MKKNYIIILIIILTIIFYFYSNQVKIVRLREFSKNSKICPYELDENWKTSKIYFNDYYERLKKRNIKMFYVDGDKLEKREIQNEKEMIDTLRYIDSKVYNYVEGKWFITKRKFFSLALGLDEELKNDYIFIPENEKKVILKNIEKYPWNRPLASCSFLEILVGEY